MQTPSSQRAQDDIEIGHSSKDKNNTKGHDTIASDFLNISPRTAGDCVLEEFTSSTEIHLSKRDIEESMIVEIGDE